MSPHDSTEPGVWATIREAIRGTEADLTAVGIGRAVALIAIPSVLEMSMESLFAVVDIFVVARLGSDAVATVGLTESLMGIVYTVAMGLAAGATAIVARRIGEKKNDLAAAAAGQTILLAVLASAVIGAIGVSLGPSLLGAMGASGSVLATGSRFPQILLGGSGSIFLLFVINAIFRSAGDAATAMRTLWLANLLNIVLAPCLVFGVGPFPRLGVEGAAVATTVSRGVGVAYQLRMLSRRGRKLELRLVDFRPQLASIVEILKLASTASLQILVETASWLGLVRIVSTFGSVALAGYTIAMRIAVFALLPAWGNASAAATLVGQNLGAKSPERAVSTVRTIARYNVVYLGSVGVLFFAFAPQLLAFFADDPAVIVEGIACLRIVAVGLSVFAYGMVMVQAFNGAGDTVTPLLVNLVCFWGFKLPFAYVVSRFIGTRGLYASVTGAYVLQSVVGAVLFKRGRWKRARA